MAMSLLDDEDVLIDRAIEASEMKRKHVQFWSFFLHGFGAHGVEVGQEFVTELLDVINNDCIIFESLQKHKDRPVHVSSPRLHRYYACLRSPLFCPYRRDIRNNERPLLPLSFLLCIFQDRRDQERGCRQCCRIRG